MYLLTDRPAEQGVKSSASDYEYFFFSMNNIMMSLLRLLEKK